jgi:DNA mismatch repair ATPase MutS
MALFSGLLGFFSGKQVRLIAITHMYEVFRRQLIPEAGKLFKFSHMKVIPDKVGLCYLYKLTDGLGEEESFAIECARESGIPEDVLNKGKIKFQQKNSLFKSILKL